jgi:hypothetical protein
MVFGPGTGDPLAVINKAFAAGLNPTSPQALLKLTAVDVLPPFTLDASAAAGTVFEGGPATLPQNQPCGGGGCTTGVLASSLPPGSKIIYKDANGTAVVALIPPTGSVTGEGNIVIFGWDWFDAFPIGTADGGWQEVLDRAASIPRGSAIPTLSEWAMMIMFALLVLFGLWSLRRPSPRPA